MAMTRRGEYRLTVKVYIFFYSIGYNFPKDQYVLKGSCGLKYSIKFNDGSNDHFSGNKSS